MNRRKFLAVGAASAVGSVHALSSLARAEALEESMLRGLEANVIARPQVCDYGRPQEEIDADLKRITGKIKQMGDDPRLPLMPAEPTLVDFFEKRFARMPTNHLLQSAALALKSGLDEETVLACLLHDIAVAGLVRSDHGYWGAQLVEPYVSERVSWGIRFHQALRFFADPAVGYDYPEAYVRYFGENYVPDAYVKKAAEYARNHKWYMTARQITINDVYAFDPNTNPSLDDFIDIIGRHFRQPVEGLGFDDSPVAHMWRTMIWPTNFL